MEPASSPFDKLFLYDSFVSRDAAVRWRQPCVSAIYDRIDTYCPLSSVIVECSFWLV